MKQLILSPHNPDSTDMTKARQVVRIVNEHPGDIISEYPIFNIMCDRPILFQPFIMSTLARQDLWDVSLIVGDIERKKFALVITTNDILEETFFFRWHPRIVESFRKSYQLFQRIERGRGINYFIYTPQPEP